MPEEVGSKYISVRLEPKPDGLSLVVDVDEPDPDKRRELETEVGLAVTKCFQDIFAAMGLQAPVGSMHWTPEKIPPGFG